MANQTIWIGIVVGVFFVGIGVSYAIFSSSYDPNSMKFQNQQLFDQMMSQNPKMSQLWLDSMMQDPNFMQTLMEDDEFMHEMKEIMSEHSMIEDSMMDTSPIEQHETMLELVEEIMDEKELRGHMFAHIIEDQELVHQMFTLMDSNPELKEHMEAHVTGDIARYENP